MSKLLPQNTANIAPITAENAAFQPKNGTMAAQIEQEMQQRFLQHFESMDYRSAIAPDAGEWLAVPEHRHTFAFNMCERVASKMCATRQDVWVGTQIDRGRAILQRLGLEIEGKPRMVRDENNPDLVSLEYDVKLAPNAAQTQEVNSLDAIAKTMQTATKHYYRARKEAMDEMGEAYIEPAERGAMR